MPTTGYNSYPIAALIAMRKHLYSRTSSAFLLVVVGACADLTAANGGDIASPALWEVTGNDKTLYLFGSVHQLPKGLDWRRGPFESVFRAAPEVWFESLIGTSGIGLTSGKKGNWYETADVFTRNRVDAAARACRLPAVPRDVAAWAAGLLLSNGCLSFHGYSLQHGVEHILQKEARKYRITQRYFETRAEQIAILDGLDKDSQMTFLQLVTDDILDGDDMIASASSAWARGDMEQLGALMARNWRLSPFLHDRLIARRNRKWAADIEAIKSGSLIIVGAAHLTGPDNLLQLLEEKGMRHARLQ